MPKTVPLEIRVADLPQMQQFIGSVVGLLKVLAKTDGIPAPVMEAAHQVRQAAATLGARDIGPAPGSDEDVIRAAMNVAQKHPGRIVTATGLPGDA